MAPTEQALVERARVREKIARYKASTGWTELISRAARVPKLMADGE